MSHTEHREPWNPLEQTVSVVIPTIGRPELRNAVESALGQTSPPLEVWVCADTVAELNLPKDSRLRVLRVGPGAGGNAARRAGVEASSGDAIALLDDDDIWDANKLEKQLAALQGISAAEAWIATCRATIHTSRGGHDIWPKDKILGCSIPEYLFKKSRLRERHSFLQASTLLVPRWMAIGCPFDPSATFHQDLGWLLALSNQFPELTVKQVWEPLIDYFEQSGSVSRKITTQMSAAWAEANLLPVSRRLYGDFLLTQTMFMARSRIRPIEAVRVFVTAISKGRPGVHALAHATSVLVRMPIFFYSSRKTGNSND